MIKTINEAIKIIQSTIYSQLIQMQKHCHNYVLKTITIVPLRSNKKKNVTFHILKNKKVRNCKKCLLHKTRKNIVFGSGNKNAKLMFIGEAPGFFEDNKGLPFIGLAGNLLNKMITAMEYKRKDVYICNTIKCRPPNNRNPKKEEIKKCNLFLKKQIQIIKPKIIITLGFYAYKAIFKTHSSVGKVRGKFINYKGINVMPTYHPSYLLRNPEKKTLVWKDLQKIKK